MATPSSANLATALTDETGSGAAVFDHAGCDVSVVVGIFTITEHDHLCGNNFGAVMFVAFFIFPFTRLQASFNIDLLSFSEELFAGFGMGTR